MIGTVAGGLLFALATLGDCITTLYAVARGLGEEQVAVAKFFLRRGSAAFVTFEVVVALIVSLGGWPMWQLGWWAGLCYSSLAIAWKASIVVSNVNIIRRSANS